MPPAGTVEPTSSRGSTLTATSETAPSVATGSQTMAPPPSSCEPTRPPAIAPRTPNDALTGRPTVSFGVVSTHPSREQTPRTMTVPPVAQRTIPNRVASPTPAISVSKLITPNIDAMANRKTKTPRPTTAALTRSKADPSSFTSRRS
ncbi:hypothetical protein C451_01175 [Halococcus thailandensis JCM 13552]|uniref:Uncharacterized protein n=2 Tax=Halococcus thailandensis TaxID=335952 RepID=M0NFP4_9EURY|nr:hypothetical protein C451_01175 [Halococcus thailandensis JCM 13552]